MNRLHKRVPARLLLLSMLACLILDPAFGKRYVDQKTTETVRLRSALELYQELQQKD